MSENLREALRRAFGFGELYCQQADNESYIQNRRAPETQAKFQAFVDETVAALSAQEAPASPPEPLTNLVCDAVDGYKTGLAGGPMGIVSAAFDCGWISGHTERLKAAQSAPPASQDQSVNVAAQDAEPNKPAAPIRANNPAAATPMPLEPVAPVNWVRDGIADFIADYWPHNEYWPPTIAERIREIEIRPPISAQPPADTVLRWAVKRMAYLLAHKEWAEHISNDPDVVELENRITEVLGAQPPSSELLLLAEKWINAAITLYSVTTSDDNRRARMNAVETADYAFRQALRGAQPPSADAVDAARYRWLRDERETQQSDGTFLDAFDEDNTLLWGDALDAAIDAAMGETHEQG